MQPLVLHTFVVAGSCHGWVGKQCRSKHVEQLRNIGIINSATQSHRVGYFYNIYITIMMHGSMKIKFRKSSKHFFFETSVLRMPYSASPASDIRYKTGVQFWKVELYTFCMPRNKQFFTFLFSLTCFILVPKLRLNFLNVISCQHIEIAKQQANP